MRTIKRALLLLATASLLAACAGTPVSLGTRPSAPVPAGAARQITAEACGFQLFLFIPIAVNGRLANAYSDLEAQANRDFITDVQISESWNWAFVGTLYCTALQAKAIAGKAAAGPGTATSPSGYPRRLDGEQAAAHFARNTVIQANTRRLPFTLTLSPGKAERTCNTCPVPYGEGTMSFKDDGAVCFAWKGITYPGSGCFEVVQTGAGSFQLRGLNREGTIEYSVKP